MRAFLFTFLILFSFHLRAQQSPDQERQIEFPDIPGYLTFKCDFHQHTVFSDGSVWPNIRVEEAVKDGLDAISITDHLEYQPHVKDIPNTNRNRSCQIAQETAQKSAPDLMVFTGAEITRNMPPGHANAIFLKDVNQLLVDDSIEVFRRAKAQGAFIFWNHPHWTRQKPDGMAALTEVQKYLIKEGLLNGIEVVNDDTYSDEAIQIALDNNLTMMGNSDIHGLIDWRYHVPQGGHRPVTLVFAKEKSEKSVKEALFNRRTAVWFNNTLIGREEYLVPLIKQSVTITETKYNDETTVLALTLENLSDAVFIMENGMEYTLHRHPDVFMVKPHTTTTIEVKTIDKLRTLALKLRVLNAVTAPKTHPVVTWQVTID